jgi:hypothetical protein
MRAALRVELDWRRRPSPASQHCPKACEDVFSDRV